MTGKLLTELFQGLAVLSILLLLGTFLRNKFKIFQTMFLPASVIGGFIGLIVIQLAGYYPDSVKTTLLSFNKTWVLLPGLLIVPVVAAVPLGLVKKKGAGISSASRNVLVTFAILMGVAGGQKFIGYFSRSILETLGISNNLYQPFGIELTGGFVGGHGTAGVIGKLYESMNLSFWEIGQGVTTTFATIGLVGGMVLGILMINIYARKGKTTLLKDPSDLPVLMKKGVIFDVNQQPSSGRDSTMNSNIDSLTLHLAIIFAGCGLSYLLLTYIKKLNITFLNSIPIWAVAIMVMFIVNKVINSLGLMPLICSKTKSKITGMLSEFAIVAAIASMPLKAVMAYATPIAIMSVICFMFTAFLCLYLCGKFFNDCQFERAISIWGCSCGVFLTGLMLLKICDPDYKLPALSDYSVGFSFTSMIFFIMLPIEMGIIVNYKLSPAMASLIGLAQLVICLVMIITAKDRSAVA